MLYKEFITYIKDTHKSLRLLDYTKSVKQQFSLYCIIRLHIHLQIFTIYQL